MGIEPMSGLRIAVGADLDVGAAWFMVGEIPTFPAAPLVWRILRRSVFLFSYKIPFPGSILFGQPFPRLIP
jgi:hypothetical protein